MAHYLYHTLGIVLDASPAGEANRYIKVFTRELGMVNALAQGIRFEASKLRYNLQTFSISNIGLVRGREVWRVVGAQESLNIFHELRHEPQKIKVLSRVALLLWRLVKGEERHAELFDYLKESFELCVKEQMSNDELMSFEALVVLSILAFLGYGPDDLRLREIAKKPATKRDVESFSPFRRHAVREINKALKESHL